MTAVFQIAAAVVVILGLFGVALVIASARLRRRGGWDD